MSAVQPLYGAIIFQGSVPISYTDPYIRTTPLLCYLIPLLSIVFRDSLTIVWIVRIFCTLLDLHTLIRLLHSSLWHHHICA